MRGPSPPLRLGHSLLIGARIAGAGTVAILGVSAAFAALSFAAEWLDDARMSRAERLAGACEEVLALDSAIRGGVIDGQISPRLERLYRLTCHE